MSITTEYEMATSLTPDEVYALLRDNLEFVTGDIKHRNFRSSLRTSNDGLRIQTFPPAGSGSVQDAFGFNPTVCVALHPARADDAGYLEGQANMLRTVNWLISYVEGDAVLLFNSDIPVLLRKGNKIWLDRKDRFWRADGLALLTFPYEWKTLPKY
jgi:hypothetical protein